jgi:hypothetical protein
MNRVSCGLQITSYDTTVKGTDKQDLAKTDRARGFLRLLTFKVYTCRTSHIFQPRHFLDKIIMKPKSVLVIGASGRTGTHIMQQLFRYPVKPDVYAFCRDPKNKLDNAVKNLCSGIFQGDARVPADLERALNKSRADLVIVAVGNSRDKKQSDVRTRTAQALVKVLQKPEYYHVNVAVVSRVGAGKTPIRAGWGRGMLMKLFSRRVLKDHGGQEEMFLSNMRNRTMVVRPIGLTDDAETGRVFELHDCKKRLKSLRTDRMDLAQWLVFEGLFGKNSDSNFYGNPIIITGM